MTENLFVPWASQNSFGVWTVDTSGSAWKASAGFDDLVKISLDDIYGFYVVVAFSVDWTLLERKCWAWCFSQNILGSASDISSDSPVGENPEIISNQTVH